MLLSTLNPNGIFSQECVSNSLPLKKGLSFSWLVLLFFSVASLSEDAIPLQTTIWSEFRKQFGKLLPEYWEGKAHYSPYTLT